MRRFIGLLLLLSLLSAGCQTPAAPAAATEAATLPAPSPSPTSPTATATARPPTPSQAPTLPAATTAAAAALPIPSLSLAPCEVGPWAITAACGALHVPEDRSRPDGRAMDLKIVVVRAYGHDPAPDPLFYIAGGPGNVATSDDIVTGVRNLLWAVNAQHDLVFLDQRGTNDGHRLTCEYPSFSIAEAPQSQVDDWMKGCLAGLDGDPRFYTTAEAMRDLDQARLALGYDKINLFGISYGAAAVQVYMRMYPEHVRTAVIDHGTALDLPFFQAFPRASQSALDQVFTYCEQDEKCQAAYPDIRGDWQAVLDRLAKGPVVTNFTPPGADAPAQVDLDDLVDGVHHLMYTSGTYTQLPFLVHALATQEDWTPILMSLNEQGSSSSEDSEENRFLFMANSIFCFEPAWGDDPEAIARLNPGAYITDLQVRRAEIQQKICAALPKPDPSLIYGPGKPVPLSALMLNSLLDPQNPPANMDLALKEFTRSRVVVEPTEGHDTSAFPCRWKIIAQAIQQGSVEGLDTSCMEQIKPTFVIGQ